MQRGFRFLTPRDEANAAIKVGLDAAAAAQAQANASAARAEQATAAAVAARDQSSLYLTQATTAAKVFDTIADGLAGVVNGATFGVRAGGSDGLARLTYYRRDSASASTKLIEPTTSRQMADEYGLAPRKGRTLALRSRTMALVHNAAGVPVLGFDDQGKLKTSLALPDQTAAINAAVAALPNATTVVNAALAELPVRKTGKGRTLAIRTRVRALIVDPDGVPVAGLDEQARLQVRRPVNATYTTMDDAGRYAPFIGPNYEGYMLDGMTVRKNAAGEVYAPASAEILGVFLYGQSYFASNNGGGKDGAVDRLRGAAKMPLELLCLNDGRGPIGWNQDAQGVIPTGFVPYTEDIKANNPSIAGPIGLRVAEDFHHRGQRVPLLLRSAASDASRLEVLSPPDVSWHVSAFGTPFNKFTTAVTKFAELSRSLGLTPHVPAIFWCQGQSNRGTSYAQCVEWLTILWTRMQQVVVTATGQRRLPAIVVCQNQSDHENGNWEIIKAQVDLCKTRPDWVLGMAGWGVSQHDQTHFSSEGCIDVGAALGIVLGQLLLGRAWSAPFIRSAKRDGNVITVQIGGQPVVEDISRKTRRHYLSEKNVADGSLTTPVPFAGFSFYPTDTASTAAITAYEIAPDGWSIKLTISEAVPGRIAHAWYNTTRRPSGAVSTNESANRGTLRARDTYTDSWTATGDVRFWMASDYADVA